MHRRLVCRCWAAFCTIFALVVVGLLAPASSTPATAAPSQGAAPTTTPTQTDAAQVRIHIKSVSPSIVTADDAVTVSGTIHNIGDSPVERPAVAASLSRQGLDLRSQVRKWGDGTADIAVEGAADSGTLATTLAAGSRTTFQVTVPSSAIETSYGHTTLPLLLEVVERGKVGDGSSAERTVVGSLRTFLPVFTADEPEAPLDLAVMAPLTLPGSAALFSGDPSKRAEAWTKAVSPTSPVGTLVVGARDIPLTYLVDPTLLDPPRPNDSLPSPEEPASPDEPGDGDTQGPAGDDPTATSEPTVPGPEGVTSPGASAEEQIRALSSWLGEALAERPDGTVWALPEADLDVSGAMDAGAEDDDLARYLPDSGDVPGARRDVVWPVPSRVDSGRLSRFQQVWAHAGLSLTAAMVPSSALKVPSGLTPPGSLVLDDAGTVIGYDDRLSALMGASTSPDANGEHVQRFLAETLAAFQERPAVSRSMAVAIPRGTQLPLGVVRQYAKAWDSAPWLKVVPGDALVESASKPEEQITLGQPSLGSPTDPLQLSRVRQSPLDRKRVDEVATTGQEVVGASTVLVEPGEYASQWSTTLRQLYSTRWRGHVDQWRDVHAAARRAGTQITNGIQITSTSVNFITDDGTVPVTVVNDLDVAVHHLSLRLTPSNRRVQVTDQPDEVEIGPKSRTTVRFGATALAAGLVDVRAELSSPHGTPIGDPAEVSMRIQPTSTWIYWVLGPLAALVLVLGVWRALRRPSTIEQARAQESSSGTSSS